MVRAVVLPAVGAPMASTEIDLPDPGRVRSAYGSPPPASATPTCPWPTARCGSRCRPCSVTRAPARSWPVGAGVTARAAGRRGRAQLVAVLRHVPVLRGRRAVPVRALGRRGRHAVRDAAGAARRSTPVSAPPRSPRRPSCRWRACCRCPTAYRSPTPRCSAAPCSPGSAPSPTRPGCGRASPWSCSASAASASPTLQSARIAGASTIIAVDVRPEKEELALAQGATHFLVADDATAKTVTVV